jgi:hypothetical protein
MTVLSRAVAPRVVGVVARSRPTVPPPRVHFPTDVRARDSLDMVVSLVVQQIRLVSECHDEVWKVVTMAVDRQAQFVAGPVRDTVNAIASDYLLSLTGGGEGQNSAQHPSDAAAVPGLSPVAD